MLRVEYGLRPTSGARATAGGGRSGERVVAAARLRMWPRVLLEEADAYHERTRRLDEVG